MQGGVFVLQDAPTVTDAGLASLVLCTSNLTSLRLSNLPRVGGKFLFKLLESCPELGSLHLENLPCCWEARGFDAPLSRKPIRLHTLNVTGCKVDVGTAALLIRCQNLRALTFDGQPSVLRVAAAYWCAPASTVCLGAHLPSCRLGQSQQLTP